MRRLPCAHRPSRACRVAGPPSVDAERAARPSRLRTAVDVAGTDARVARAHRPGQPWRRVDRCMEGVEIVDGERRRWAAGEGDGERQHLSHRHLGRGGTQPFRCIAETFHICGNSPLTQRGRRGRTSWRTRTRHRPGTIPTRSRTTPSCQANSRRCSSTSRASHRCRHPHVQIRMGVAELPSGGQPQAPIPSPDRRASRHGAVNTANRSGAADEVAATVLIGPSPSGRRRTRRPASPTTGAHNGPSSPERRGPSAPQDEQIESICSPCAS